MNPLLLREADVRRLLDMRTTIDVVEAAFLHWSQGEANNIPRHRATAPGVVLHTMGAAAGYLGYVGVKSYTTTRSGAHFHVLLYNASSGELEAIIEADYLGQLRTGAATGVAIAYLAPPETHELGLFGAGKQARTQLMAAAAVRKIRRAFVYSRHEATRQRFAVEMSEQLGIEVVSVDRPSAAAEDLPLVITATTSATPVVDSREVNAAALVCAVGSNWPQRCELDVATVQLADMVVCDSVAACRAEAGDLLLAESAGAFAWSNAVELTDVIAGRSGGRPQQGHRVLFKSVGLAIEDVAVAAKVVELARAHGVGG